MRRPNGSVPPLGGGSGTAMKSKLCDWTGLTFHDGPEAGTVAPFFHVRPDGGVGREPALFRSTVPSFGGGSRRSMKCKLTWKPDPPLDWRSPTVHDGPEAGTVAPPQNVRPGGSVGRGRAAVQPAFLGACPSLEVGSACSTAVQSSVLEGTGGSDAARPVAAAIAPPPHAGRPTTPPMIVPACVPPSAAGPDGSAALGGMRSMGSPLSRHLPVASQQRWHDD